jgi:hypothetical protein
MTPSILTTLTKVAGVTAACCGDPAAFSFSFDSAVLDDERAQFQKIFRTMVELLKLMPNEEELKITLNAQSLVLRRNKGIYVGVVAIKSHPVVKSLQRMVRSAFRKQGVPLPTARKKPVVASAPMPPALVAVPDPTSIAPTVPITVTPPADPPTPPPEEDDNKGWPPSSL